MSDVVCRTLTGYTSPVSPRTLSINCPDDCVTSPVSPQTLSITVKATACKLVSACYIIVFYHVVRGIQGVQGASGVELNWKVGDGGGCCCSCDRSARVRFDSSAL